MSSHRHASLLRSLSQGSAIIFFGSLLTACSGDAIRFEDALTTSSSMTSNQHAIMKKSASVNQTYPGDDRAEVSETTGTIAQPDYNSGIKVSKPQPLAPLAKADPVAPASDASGIKISKPAYTPPVVDAEANDSAPAPRLETTKATAPNKPIILAPRSTARQPLKIVGTDPISTGSVKRAEPVAEKTAATKAVPAKGWKGAGGSKVTVKPGETLYNLSRRYGVPVDAIMKANGISDASGLKVGTQVLIPAYTYDQSAKVSAPDSNPMTKAARATTGFKGEVRNGKIAVPKERTITAAKPVEVAKNTSAGQYVVKGGDTLYNISRRYGVSAAALRSANGLSGNNIRLGQALRIPAGGSKVVAKAEIVEAPAIKVEKPQKIVAEKKVDPVMTGSVPAASTQADVKVSKEPAAPKETITIAKRSAEQVNTPAQTASGSFRWPTNGRVITKFGERVNGNTSDGIDISVPVGTPVKAAENGTVIYSGSELADFGNLILVSHAGGWVSAYAHASKNNVKRGDKVNRGQVIAMSGKTGNATRPKLHFELRKDSMPVNPLKHLASR